MTTSSERKCRRITLSGKTIEEDFSATEEQEEIGESRRKMTSRVSMTVTCVSALESLGGGAKKSNPRLSQGQQLNSY